MAQRLRALIWCAVSTVAQTEDDKVSLPHQESEAKALCEREGWLIVDTLRVPGHSRHYNDIHKMNRDMLADGIDALDKLMRHWGAKDFDVLICRDSERFARKQPSHATIIAETIEAGARIFSFADGWVDEQNYNMFIAMAGYKTASDVKRLVKGRKVAMRERARRGLHTATVMPLSHKQMRDEMGKALKTVVNEDYRPLWNDLATCILEGVTWWRMEKELFERFGYTNENGEQYREQYFYRLVFSPAFWGNSIIGLHWRGLGERDKYGLWVFDSSYPAPDGVTIFYDTFEPVYTGYLATQIKTELRRRRLLVKGNSRSDNMHAFSGLLICAECGYTLIYNDPRKNNWRGYRCVTNYRRYRNRGGCENFSTILYSTLQEWFEVFLQKAIEAGDIEFIAGDTTDYNTMQARLEADIADCETLARNLILKQAKAPPDVHSIYDTEIETVSKRLRALKREFAQTRQIVNANQKHHVTETLDAIAEMGLDNFWKLPEHQIHHYLFQLLGDYVLAVRDKRIIEVRYKVRR